MDVEDQMGEAWGSSDGDEEDEARSNVIVGGRKAATE